MNDLTLYLCFRKSEKVSLTSVYERENELGRVSHCPEYSQQHTGILLREMFLMLMFIWLPKWEQFYFFLLTKAKFFMQKLLKKDFKDIKLLTDMWVMTAYINF